MEGEIKLMMNGMKVTSALYFSVPDRNQIIESWRTLYNHKIQSFFIHVCPKVSLKLENKFKKKYYAKTKHTAN
jgi:hypothetical protein